MTKGQAKEFLPIIKAYSEGKIIQVRDPFKGWIDIYFEPEFNFPECYRIKPDPIERPYTNAIEFINASKKHGPYIRFKNTNNFNLPSDVRDGGININYQLNVSDFLSYSNLFKLCVWQDDSPCSIIE